MASRNQLGLYKYLNIGHSKLRFYLAPEFSILTPHLNFETSLIFKKKNVFVICCVPTAVSRYVFVGHKVTEIPYDIAAAFIRVELPTSRNLV